MIRCIIVDDEPPSRDELVYILSGLGGVEIAAQAGSAARAVELVRALEPDLVFLDIQMPGHDGFHVLKELEDMDRPPYFVFATAYEQYAVKAFDESAADYLLKPFSANRVALAVDRVAAKIKEKQNGLEAKEAVSAILERLEPRMALLGPGRDRILRVPLEDGGRSILVEPSKIVRFSSEDRRIAAHLSSVSHFCPAATTLDRLQEKLAGWDFFRANRKELVNMRHIKEYAPWMNGRYVLSMDDDMHTEVSVSRGRIKELRQRLGI